MGKKNKEPEYRPMIPITVEDAQRIIKEEINQMAIDILGKVFVIAKNKLEEITRVEAKDVKRSV